MNFEKDFLEKFPSLKGKWKIIVDEESTAIDDPRTTVFDVMTVEMFCLDKSKVKQAIQKISAKYANPMTAKVANYNRQLKWLLNELGLK